MLSAIVNFISYWYFRYTVVTELYMVEKWERYTIHTIFGTVFLLCFFFNYAVLLTLVSNLISLTKTARVDDIMKTMSIAS